MFQHKIDFKIGGIWFALFLARRRRYYLSIDDYGLISENKIKKRYSDVKRNLDRKTFFKKI